MTTIRPAAHFFFFVKHECNHPPPIAFPSKHQAGGWHLRQATPLQTAADHSDRDAGHHDDGHEPKASDIALKSSRRGEIRKSGVMMTHQRYGMRIHELDDLRLCAAVSRCSHRAFFVPDC